MRSELANQNKNLTSTCQHPRLRRALMAGSQIQPLVKARPAAAIAQDPILTPEAVRYCWTLATAFVILVGHFVTNVASF